MHSGLILLLWLAGVVLVQQMTGFLLAVSVSVGLLLAWVYAPSRCLRLLRRIRFFLLAIIVFFAWFTPGEALWAAWPVISPSREGAMLSLIHAGRLVAVVCAVAILLQRLSVERLVSGLYTLCRPFAIAGLSAERLAVRLLLTLRYIEGEQAESGHSSNKKNWRSWLVDQPVSEDQGESITFDKERFGWRDVLAVVGVMCLLIVIEGWWW